MPSKLARLRDKLADEGSTESTDLALDLVLNEIVQQVRLTTRATGAAIALLRADEMVCRATTGGNAPDLGVRLDTKTGLSGACVQTRRSQLCNDTELDDRVDVAACRALGVRSILVLPLLSGEVLLGAFEVFSPLPNAFGDRDVQTLQAFVHQILYAVEEAGTLSGKRDKPAEVTTQLLELPMAPEEPAEPDPPHVASPPVAQVYEADGGQEAPVVRRDYLTQFLTVLVIGLSILLGILLGMHFTRQKRIRAHAPSASFPAAAPAAEGQPQQADSPSPLASISTKEGSGNSLATAPASPEKRQATPSGGLVVYRNDRVVFQMPPSQGTTASEPLPSADDTPFPNLPEVAPEAASNLVVQRFQPAVSGEARTSRTQSTVHVRVAVGPSGSVTRERYVDGPAVLAPAALEAVRKWRFTPYAPSGSPVEFQTVVTVHFSAP